MPAQVRPPNAAAAINMLFAVMSCLPATEGGLSNVVNLSDNGKTLQMFIVLKS